jgi:tRNA pseudouridine55 synthase
LTHSALGLILLDKPMGITSFKALNVIKARIGSPKVGHTGTLDAFASGLLLALAGSLTKIASLFVGLDKTYEAVVTFGQGTDTLDPEGQVTSRGEIPQLERIRRALPGFLGDLEQLPPIFSAVHVEGQRAHRLARAGKIPELKPRRVSIYTLDILSYRPPDLILKIRCSKGTYIRSLARDLAEAVGTCAFVSNLRRTHVGDFNVAEAVAPEDFLPEKNLLAPAEFLRRMAGIETLLVKENAGSRVRHGIPLRDEFFLQPPAGDGTCALLSPAGELIAVARRENGRYHYLSVIPGSGV